MSVFNDQQIQELITAIISRLAKQLGADGSKGTVLVVFSGATVGLPEALDQIRQIILTGYRIQIAYSPQAQMLYGETVREQLAGFPHVQEIAADQWYGALMAAEVVLVPMLSLNTASKVSLLIADTLPTNLILHGLSLGKPVIAATNGADPADRHWARRSGSRQVSPAFRNLAGKRLQSLAELGCICTDVSTLCSHLFSVHQDGSLPSPIQPAASPQAPQVITFTGQIISAAHVRNAHSRGANLGIQPGTVITPLAREMAAQLQIRLIQQA